MLDKIREFLRQHKDDEPHVVAISLVLNNCIPSPKNFKSVTPREFVDVFFAEKENAHLTLQEYIEAVKDDYEQSPESYEKEGLTGEELQNYFCEIERIADEHQIIFEERQRIASEKMYHQFREWVEAAIERNLPKIDEEGTKAFVPIIKEKIDEIGSLLREDNTFRNLMAVREIKEIETMLASSRADSQELLNKVPVDEIKKTLQESLRLDVETVDLISKYLRRILEEVLLCPSRYRINGLFKGKEEGSVRDVYVTIFPKGEGKLDYGFELDTEHGEDLDRSAKMGQKAAIALMHKWYPGIEEPSYYNIRLHIESGAEREIRYGGASIGLATALGIIARCTEQVIGVQQVGDVAVTGEIANEHGLIKSVGDIEWKTQAIIDLNRQGIKPVPIKYLFVPKENEAEAIAANERYGGSLEIRAFNDLESLIKEGILFEPFKQYLETISRVEAPAVTISDEVWNQINRADTKRFAILGEFDKDKRSTAKALATRFAQERLSSKASPEETPHDTLIPVTLDAGRFSIDYRLFDSVSSAVSKHLEVFNSEPFDEALIHRALRTGRFALIISGLYITEDMPFFAPGAAMSEYEKFYSDSRIIFVCTESSWNKYKNRIADSQQCSVIPLYEGRSTFLDKHIDEVINPTNGIAKRGILACYGSDDFTPKEFFYPGQPDKAHYIELQVQRLDEDGNRMESPGLLSEVIAEGKDRHILLLADGGAGKTTLLLKLFFDCLEGKCKLKTPENRVNDSWKQLIVPLFVNVGGLVDANYKALYQLLPEPHSELEATENILIMLDGLNEITQSIRERARDLANCLHQFLKTLDEKNPNHWIILSCRKQEEIRGFGSLIGQIERDETKEYFVRYEILDLSLEAGENYLHRTVPQNAEQLINALGERQKDILKNPMLLYLFSTLNPVKIEEMEKEQKRPLNRSLIYKMAMDEWISKQFEGKAFEIFRKEDAPRELLKILAKEMVDKGLTSISEAEAVEIFEAFLKEQRPAWWPKKKIRYRREEWEEPVAARDILNELVAGGLLKVSG
ncbi:TPA: hypothetical protein EYP66_20435 [Candidatus Poribacteria bacterium]|nr:hypothetical protein [Candidatus Poribacteria bacterium]